MATPSGEAEGRLDPEIRKLSRDIGIFIVDTYQQFVESVEVTKQIEHHLAKASEGFQKLSMHSEYIAAKFNLVSELNNYEPFGRFAEVYQGMADAFCVQSTILAEESASIATDLRMMFDFDLKEIEGLEDVAIFNSQLMVKRNMFSNEYKEQKDGILKRKETAFLTKDLKKWDIDQENLPVPKLDLLQDKDLAMRFMFTKVEFQ